MKIRVVGLVFGLAVAVAQPGMAVGAQGHETAGQAVSCTLVKDTYSCDWGVFKKTLADAKTVALRSKPMDPGGDRQLNKLVVSLGKEAVTLPEERADLVMVLVPAESSGIFFGPSGRVLATLRVYGRGSLTDRGPLLWAETLDGQPDIPWPSVVYQLVSQFQSRVNGR